MDIKDIRERVRAGHYLIKSHAIQHALKEGFDRKHIVKAIFAGSIIEAYPDEYRVLVCGTTTIDNTPIYMHIVCEYADAVYVELVTAYLPDELEWEKPPYKRRKRKK